MSFEDLYIALKEKEGRKLKPAQIQRLPELPKGHPWTKEWEYRKQTLSRFDEYLKHRSFYKAVEIFCGTGWFSNWLADRVPHVIGQDILRYELDIGANIFARSNLNLVFTEDIIGLIEKERPDLVVLNSSLQYFNPNSNFLMDVKDALPPDCEIHIMDTPIYLSEKAAFNARYKQKVYLNKLGFPEMHNHCFQYEINNLVYVDWLYTPPMGLNKLLKPKASPYPWGRIRT